MAVKAEISWRRRTPAGIRIAVSAHHVGDRWLFYAHERRFEAWRALDHPPLEDWLKLLDAVERRINRRRLRPEEATRLKKTILERFPEAQLGSPSFGP